jgi:hypothetical protein
MAAKEYYDNYGLTGVDSKKLKNELLYNLYKKPEKEKGQDMPRFQAYSPDAVHQADLLFLPHDKNYKYALNVVDIATRLMDSEPLKEKTSEAVLDAFKKFMQGKS